MTNRMKLLIAYEGSICANAAIEDLLRAGLPREVEALVISVADVWLPVGDEPIDLSIPEEISAAVKRARARAVQAVAWTLCPAHSRHRRSGRHVHQGAGPRSGAGQVSR